jgi:hypothetical protein
MVHTRLAARLGAALALSLAAAAATGCSRRAEQFESEPGIIDWHLLLPPACGKDVAELLGGLKAGDPVESVPVAAVGAVNADGVIPIIFVRERAAVQLVVALKSDFPPPPATTDKYAVFYQPFAGMAPMPSHDIEALVEAMVQRLKRTEATVATPAGLKPLPRPSQPA